MKTLTQFLSLLLCLELIVGPVQGSLLMASAEAQETCPAGQAWDNSANRCLTKAQVIEVNNATKTCGDDRDCYERNAKNALNKTDVGGDNSALFKDDGSGKQKVGIAIGSGVAVGVPLLIATNVLLTKAQARSQVNAANAGKSKDARLSQYSCNPNSLLLMYSAAVALGAGEIIGSINHKAKLNAIQKEWNKSVVPKSEDGEDAKREGATEAQSQAFEYLAQNEDQVAKTTRLKKGFYLAATGLFASATAAAIVEQVSLTKAKAAILAAPGMIAAAKAKQAVPATVSIGVQEEKMWKKKLSDGRETVNRLTCSTDTTAEKEITYKDKDGKDATTTGDQTYNEIKNEEQRDLEANQLTAEQLKRENDVLTNAPNSPEAKEINSKRAKQSIDNYNNNKDPKPKPITIPKENYIDSPVKNKGTPQKGPINGFNSLNKYRSVAIHNLATATDAEQLMQLNEEFKAIEFENYSRVSYLSESDSAALKKITLAEIISNMVISPAQAQAGLAQMALGSGAVFKILPEVKKVLNGIRFGKGGEPISHKDLGALKDTVNNKVTTFIAKPTNRIALNGLLMGWVGFMTLHMDKQAKASAARADKLRSMKEDFKGGVGLVTCTAEDRQSPDKPNCFCYTSDNKINPARSNQEVCKTTIVKMHSTKEDLNNENTKTCVTQNMESDPSCSCRNNNSCLKATAGFNSIGFSPNTFKMISAGSAPSTDLFNGTVSGADISDSAGINATRIKQASDAMLAKTDPKTAKEVKEQEALMEKALLQTTSGMSLPGAFSGISALPNSPAAAAAALDKELKENTEEIEVTESATTDASPGGFSDEPAPEFGMTEADAASQAVEISEVMGKEIDFKEHDVRKDPEVNIFDTLHGLYQTKGRQKLQVKPEPAP